jgi:hypothetical protein
MNSMTTLLDHKTTLAYLAYLGYPDEPRTSALHVTKARKYDRRKGKVSRNVFLCYVCGAAGAGKTSLLRDFVRKPYKEVYEPTRKMVSVVNAVDIDGSEKYLVVSVFCSLATSTYSHNLTLPASRVWFQVRGGDTEELQENRPGRCHCLCLRL